MGVVLEVLCGAQAVFVGRVDVDVCGRQQRRVLTLTRMRGGRRGFAVHISMSLARRHGRPTPVGTADRRGHLLSPPHQLMHI